MSASLASGSYGHRPAFAGVIRRLLAGLFSSSSTAAKSTRGNYMGAATTYRTRLREARGVRELARSVERYSPGFAADLYTAASRHEGLDD